MTFKNGIYLEYYEDRHQEDLISKYGEVNLSVIEKLNEIIVRINEQDGYLKEVSNYLDEVADRINQLIAIVGDNNHD